MSGYNSVSGQVDQPRIEAWLKVYSICQGLSILQQQPGTVARMVTITDQQPNPCFKLFSDVHEFAAYLHNAALRTSRRQAVTAAGGPTGSVAQSPCVAIKTSENHTTPGAVDSGCYPNANYLFATLPAPTTDASKVIARALAQQCLARGRGSGPCPVDYSAYNTIPMPADALRNSLVCPGSLMDVLLTCDNLNPAYGGTVAACLDNPLCTWADVSKVLPSAAYNKVQYADNSTLDQIFDPAFDTDAMLDTLGVDIFSPFKGYFDFEWPYETRQSQLCLPKWATNQSYLAQLYSTYLKPAERKLLSDYILRNITFTLATYYNTVYINTDFISYFYGACPVSMRAINALIKCDSIQESREACNYVPYCAWYYGSCQLAHLEPLIVQDNSIFTSDPWARAIMNLSNMCMPLNSKRSFQADTYGSPNCSEFLASDFGRQNPLSVFDAASNVLDPAGPYYPTNLQASFYMPAGTATPNGTAGQSGGSSSSGGIGSRAPNPYTNAPATSGGGTGGSGRTRFPVWGVVVLVFALMALARTPSW
ncbi:hypothetical protein CHLRE_18g748297v5 [Chlamydomonas reinhardtii]|uniref:Uncharacterized protein n=1 Tax=Chlamydomonas reinhardtii TaxID=3055 RepID=A0A2K3CNH2_CHLRE|nr:uncharacterized protein CHLRE_18g748297v5 [Chlamydomonas reinhardtii]PNW69830.1 hypothetical protein CHLRE_18g748297v5 [Chlamydomonas reinhardtii]